jgi:2,3-bisphosphoglycerate-independent phosphoglycerate mutase
MNTEKLTTKIISYLKNKKYNFICVNFPNADMVGHTGNFEAAKKAISIVDKNVDKIVEQVLKDNGQILIIADHGNADEMLNLKTSEMMTEHTINPVPCILVSKTGKKINLKNGILADVAPTLLEIMNIEKPEEMTGKSLIK